jgi:hypothetical protein
MNNEKWAAMIESHRRDPGNCDAARRAAGVDWRTARKAWHQGSAGRKAIKDMLAEEAAIRRAIVADKQPALEAIAAAERVRLAEEVASLQTQVAELKSVADHLVNGAQRARATLLEVGGLDAEKDFAREGTMARALQSFALSRLALAQIAMNPKAIQNIGRVIVEAATRGDLDLPTAIKLHRQLGQDAKAVGELVEISQQVTRRWLGAPTDVVRHQHEEVALTVPELEAQQARISTIVAQLKEHATPALPAPLLALAEAAEAAADCDSPNELSHEPPSEPVSEPDHDGENEGVDDGAEFTGTPPPLGGVL